MSRQSDFARARVNWLRMRCSFPFLSSTAVGNEMASSMTPTNTATAEVALFLSDCVFKKFVNPVKVKWGNGLQFVGRSL